jgi:hypothetical protein
VASCYECWGLETDGPALRNRGHEEYLIGSMHGGQDVSAGCTLEDCDTDGSALDEMFLFGQSQLLQRTHAGQEM